MGKIVRKGVEYGDSSNSADCIKYNDTKSVKEAIDDIKASSSSNPTAWSVTFNNTDIGLEAANVQDAITEVNGKLESISGRLVKVADVFADGTAGTYATNIELKSTDIYLVLIRATNDNQSLAVSPIMYGYYNPNYITVVDGKVNIILSGAWGFADVYKIV